MEHILFLKYIHIIGFTGWISSLYFITSLLSSSGRRQDQEAQILVAKASSVYKKMSNPAMMITWTAGLLMLYVYGMPWFRENTWMHQKLLLIIHLTIFHLFIKRALHLSGKGTFQVASKAWYVADKLPLIFLLTIAFLAVFRQLPQMIAGIPAVLVSVLLLYVAYFWKSKT
jgi:putative membrane protein